MNELINECSFHNWREIGSYNIRDNTNLRHDVEAKSVSDSDHRNTPRRPRGEWRYNSTLSLTSALDGSGLSTPRPGRFTPGKDPVPIV